MPLSDALSFQGSVFGRRVQERDEASKYILQGVLEGQSPSFLYVPPSPCQGKGDLFIEEGVSK